MDPQAYESAAITFASMGTLTELGEGVVVLNRTIGIPTLVTLIGNQLRLLTITVLLTLTTVVVSCSC